MSSVRRRCRWLTAFAVDERGSSAVEFALWLTLLMIPTLNVVDLGFYVFRTMQVRQAAQAGAQVAESVCGYTGNTPAVTKCQTATPALTTAMVNGAVSSTSLRSAVSLSSASEGWYCNDTTGKLVLAKSGPATTTTTWNPLDTTITTLPVARPADCHFTIASDNDAPGDYVFVNVTYPYTPVLQSASLISVLRTGAPITQSGWMRIN